MPNKKQWSIFEKDYFDVSEKIKSTSIWDFKDVNSERVQKFLLKNLNLIKMTSLNLNLQELLNELYSQQTNKKLYNFRQFYWSVAQPSHAVLNLNARDGGNRQFIGIEMMDYAENITAERNPQSN